VEFVSSNGELLRDLSEGSEFHNSGADLISLILINMTYLDNPLGSTFLEGGVTLVVAESKNNGRTCFGCWYARRKSTTNSTRAYPYGCYQHGHACTPANRKDGKQVVFMKLTGE